MPFFWITTLFIIGILVSSSFELALTIWIILLIGSVIISSAALIAVSKKLPRFDSPFFNSYLPNTRLPLFLLPIFIFLGGVAYQLALPDRTGESIYSFNDRGNETEILGTVVELPDVRDKLTLVEI